jgi:hypothetical protein
MYHNSETRPGMEGHGPNEPGSDSPFRAYEYPFMRWLEMNGFEVEYCTSIDLHADRHFLDNQLLLSMGTTSTGPKKCAIASSASSPTAETSPSSVEMSAGGRCASRTTTALWSVTGTESRMIR